MILRQAELMTKLVADLLDVGRLQTGKLSLQRELVDVSRLVQQTLADLRSGTDARGQKIVLLQPWGVGFIHARARTHARWTPSGPQPRHRPWL